MPAPGPETTTRAEALRLFLLGFVGLFLELALIRYLAGNVWNLGYFPNLVLIATFVGMGIGFVFHHHVGAARSRVLFPGALLVLLALAAFVTFASPKVPGFERWQGEVGGELFFTATAAAAGWLDGLSFALWFLAVVATFALITQRTAKLFARFAPLRAYSLDIAGSCAGIVTFMAASALQLPAWSWFLILLPFFLGAMPAGTRLGHVVPVLALAGVALLSWRQDQALLINPAVRAPIPIEVIWSPYQKVEWVRESPTTQSLFVNGVGHQFLHPPETIRQSFYKTPYEHRTMTAGRPPYRRVLVIGAGTGNDVAAALMFGATHVDAVEIDPAIADLGARHHLAEPYGDRRVRLHVNDARAFMTQATDRYDLIIFALTDSLVKVSALAQLRLENYIFTEESIRRAYELLDEGGDLLFYNAYRQRWLVHKIAATIHRATGRHPRTVLQEGDLFVLLVGPDTAGPPPAAPVTLDVPTDDWPFLYLKRRGIPALYLGVMVALLAFVAGLMVILQRSTRHLERDEAGAPRVLLKVAFVIMGMAFLLLETKGVIQFSLLFGTTWLNNSLVFLAALLLVLAANALATVVRGAWILPAAFVLLLGSCLLTLVYPLASLLAVESVATRFVLAALMTFSPIFFANLVFSVTFRDQPVAEHLFGWNLIGATLGGVAEYGSMWWGYDALAIVVAACYAAVFVLLYLAARLARARGARPPVAV